MPEEERTTQPERLNDPEWREGLEQGVPMALENYELFDKLVNVGPENYTGDERPFPDLTPEEQEFIKSILFSEVGFNPDQAETVAKYELQAHEGAWWSGKAKVTVYETERSETEDMYLHQTLTEDGKEDWFIAPADFRL